MATYGKKGSKVKKTGYVSSSPGIERARQQLADHERAMADLKATKAKKTAKKTASSKTSTAADKRAANKKSADAKRAANAAKVAARNVKDAPTDTAERRSPDTYRPDVKVGGKNTFYGTNIPTAGYTSNEIADFNARLKEDVDAGNSRGANDVVFSIAYARGGGEGNKRVGAVQSGMWKLDKGNLWAEDNINSTNDRYVIRDEKGKPTGKEVRFSDQTGVVKGPPNEWKPIGSWGENARAGIVEGQPTAAPPPASNTFVPIVDLDTPGGRVIAGPGAGTRPGAGGGVQGPYSPGGRLPAGGGGFLGGGGFYPGYPVAPMGYPSGASYPNAQDAAQGWAGQLGFNIDDRGGLLLRPWEAQSWQLSGIDPNLWNAPFAGGGLLGGGYPGGGQPGRGRPGTGGPITIPGGGTVTGDGGTVTAPGEPAGWIPPIDFTPDPLLTASGMGPFAQWSRQQHEKIYGPSGAAQTPAEAAQANRVLQTFTGDPFAFEDTRAEAARTPSVAPMVAPMETPAEKQIRLNQNARTRQQNALFDVGMMDVDYGPINPAASLSLIDQWNLSRNNPLVETFADIPGGAVAPTIPYVAPNYGLLT